MSKRHSASRRRTYGRRQHELHDGQTFAKTGVLATTTGTVASGASLAAAAE